MKLDSDGAVRVVVADEHDVVREGIKAIFERDHDRIVVGQSATVTDALYQTLALRPDVLITDTVLGAGSGIELVRELRSRGAATRCVMFASRAAVEDYYQAVLAGVDGFSLKSQPIDDLMRSVDIVAAGGQDLGQEMLDRLHAVEHAQPAGETRFLADLSERERSMVTCLAQGMTNREIADQLFLAEKTVRNNMSGVLSKLGMRNRTQLAAYATSLTPAAAR